MHPEPRPLEVVDRELRRAFAPWHKRTLGLALGLTAAAVTAALTVFHVVVQPTGAPNLWLLGQFFYGYTVTWTGVLVGAWWSFVVGFIAGFFTGFVVNFSLATWLLIVKAKADMRETSDFLDHI